HFHALLSFFSSVTAPTEIYPLSLHDALPISSPRPEGGRRARSASAGGRLRAPAGGSGADRPPRSCPRPRAPRRIPREVGALARADRKSTRLNSSHVAISYAVFCLKKKKHNKT